MKQKEDNPIKTLFEFSGDAKGKMSLSVILTVLSELFGMLPYLTAAMLANNFSVLRKEGLYEAERR